MALALVFAQMVVAGHFHRVDSTKRVISPAQTALDSAACPLCAFACHSPVKPAVAPAIERPVLTIRLIAAVTIQRAFGAPFSAWRTRAPPVILL
ncbi:hypothetical protein IMX07_07860 [bacterium]|jgi:hypothetical protein|nr:hypothetical protein [bacterium]